MAGPQQRLMATLLSSVAAGTDSAAVQALLQCERDPSFRGACAAGALDASQLQGPDGKPHTPLFIAASRGLERCVARLLELGASAGAAQGAAGLTALHVAAINLHVDTVRHLITACAASGASLDAPSHNHDTALMLVAHTLSALPAAPQSGCSEVPRSAKQGAGLAIVAALQAAGASTAAANRTGLNAVMLAAAADDATLMSALLGRAPEAEAVAAVAARDQFGNSALHMAAKGGCAAVVDALLAHGASVHQRNHVGETAFDVAAAARNAVALTRLDAHHKAGNAAAAELADSLQGDSDKGSSRRGVRKPRGQGSSGPSPRSLQGGSDGSVADAAGGMSQEARLRCCAAPSTSGAGRALGGEGASAMLCASAAGAVPACAVGNERSDGPADPAVRVTLRVSGGDKVSVLVRNEAPSSAIACPGGMLGCDRNLLQQPEEAQPAAKIHAACLSEQPVASTAKALGGEEDPEATQCVEGSEAVDRGSEWREVTRPRRWQRAGAKHTRRRQRQAARQQALGQADAAAAAPGSSCSAAASPLRDPRQAFGQADAAAALQLGAGPAAAAAAVPGPSCTSAASLLRGQPPPPPPPPTYMRGPAIPGPALRMDDTRSSLAANRRLSLESGLATLGTHGQPIYERGDSPAPARSAGRSPLPRKHDEQRPRALLSPLATPAVPAPPAPPRGGKAGACGDAAAQAPEATISTAPLPSSGTDASVRGSPGAAARLTSDDSEVDLQEEVLSTLLARVPGAAALGLQTKHFLGLNLAELSAAQLDSLEEFHYSQLAAIHAQKLAQHRALLAKAIDQSIQLEVEMWSQKHGL